MKIRSLLLGSAAVAGLTTGGYAADVLTSLNACDSLGLTGITIASDDNCVQITGEVKWEGNWGDYAPGVTVVTVDKPGTAAGTAFTIPGPGGGGLDWASRLEWNIRVKATADTANGPASAVVKFKDVEQWVVENNAWVAGIDSPYDTDALPEPGTGGDHTFGIIADEAYVSVGAANIWMIGKKGTIINKGDDEPFNFLALFNSEKVDKGVYWSEGPKISDGGIVIQTTMDLGNGLFASAGLENIAGGPATAANVGAGVLVGVLEYKGDNISAHITAVAGGILDGTIEKYAVHAGFTGTFDPVTVRAAVAADSSGYWNALGTAMATFDMFKIAVSGEAAGGGAAGATDFGVGASVGATVADGVDINLGGRFYSNAQGPDGYQVAAQVAAAVTETIKLTAELGVYGNDAGLTVPYGAVEAAYAPGGGFTSSAKVEVYANGAYKGTVKAGKTF